MYLGRYHIIIMLLLKLSKDSKTYNYQNVRINHSCTYLRYILADTILANVFLAHKNSSKWCTFAVCIS